MASDAGSVNPNRRPKSWPDESALGGIVRRAGRFAAVFAANRQFCTKPFLHGAIWATASGQWWVIFGQCPVKTIRYKKISYFQWLDVKCHENKKVFLKSRVDSAVVWLHIRRTPTARRETPAAGTRVLRASRGVPNPIV
jgi:hypothetical protein